MDLVRYRELGGVELQGKITQISARTGVHAAYVLMLVEMSPHVLKVVGDVAGQLGVVLSEREVVELNNVLLRVVEREFKDQPKADLQAFCEYLDTGDHVRPMEALKRRQSLFDLIEIEVSGLLLPKVGGLRSVGDQLGPIVKKLAKQALSAVADVDLSAKDKIQLFEKLGKLQAQLSGELVAKTQIDVGPTEQFMEILKAAKGIGGPVESIEARYTLRE